MCHECLNTQNSRPSNSQRGASAGAKTQPINVIPNPPPSSPNAAIELIGRVNEADIFNSDIQIMALIDMRTQISTITRNLCEQQGYDTYPMKQMLHLEGIGGFSIPYLGYIEATVRIPPIKDYEGCVPMLVLKSFSPFSFRVPVKLGTMMLDWAMAKIMDEELTCASSM